MGRSAGGVHFPMANSGLVWRSVAIAVLVLMAIAMTSSAAAKKKSNQPASKVKPPKNKNLVCNLLASSVSISHKAGEIIRDIYNETENQFKKNYKKIDAEATESAKKCIFASLKHVYPDVNIVAEDIEKISQNLDVPEDWIVKELDEEISSLYCPLIYNHVEQKHITIWIDPLDGSAELNKGNLDRITVLIGISVGDDSVAGVIYQPFWKNKGRAIWGVVGRGVGGITLAKNRTMPTSLDELVYITTDNEYDKTSERFMEQLRPHHLIKAGGTGYKALQLLEGKADVYLNPSVNTRRWDTSAPEALIKAAGGKLTDIHGIRYHYTKHDAEYPINNYGVFATASGYNRELLARHINLIILEIERRHMNF